jgi:excisionase family DNA binding protein
MMQINFDWAKFEELIRTTVTEAVAKSNANPVPQHYTIKEVERLLHVSRTTIYYWMKEGVLPYQKFGNAKRISSQDVERLLLQRRVAQ